MAGLIYLASPYSHKQLGVRIRRFELAVEVTSKLLLRGHTVFSPIAYGHAMARNIGTNYEVWKDFNDTMMRASEQLWVLMIDGWKDSRGIQYEIKFAGVLDIPVLFMTPDGEMFGGENANHRHKNSGRES